MLYIFPICSYNDACWCFVNLCLCKAHFGETSYGSFQFLLFVSHLVDRPIFVGFVWHHTRDIFHPVFLRFMQSALHFLDGNICKIIIIIIIITITIITIMLLGYTEWEHVLCTVHVVMHVTTWQNSNTLQKHVLLIFAAMNSYLGLCIILHH